MIAYCKTSAQCADYLFPNTCPPIFVCICILRMIAIHYYYRQLSAQKTAIPSVDHLKEIERLRGLLAASEASAKNLTAQLAGKEHGKRMGCLKSVIYSTTVFSLTLNLYIILIYL